MIVCRGIGVGGDIRITGCNAIACAVVLCFIYCHGGGCGYDGGGG